jgi:hypothetical protein
MRHIRQNVAQVVATIRKQVFARSKEAHYEKLKFKIERKNKFKTIEIKFEIDI